MEPAYFVLALLGCSDAETLCREVRVLPGRFQSLAACQAAIETALPANADMDFPVLMARCRKGNWEMTARNKARAG